MCHSKTHFNWGCNLVFLPVKPPIPSSNPPILDLHSSSPCTRLISAQTPQVSDTPATRKRRSQRHAPPSPFTPASLSLHRLESSRQPSSPRERTTPSAPPGRQIPRRGRRL
ncbi:hypothetical protein GUJ93_ZPchr0010g11125 [Zizania palustris]|uniref:Uncharacterized protein n=1 Tax=Zizania palustris TaxID=103762 RepID=A0A8J5WAT0_ZIZPA|nr:hypothetical protein GUJ93_ZPchr0010g11125 [Zizania palustris]